MRLGKPARPTPIRALRRALAGRLGDLGWYPVGRLSGPRLVRALARETGEGHPLCGRTLTALARAEGSDDVLFATDDGALWQVHLTHATSPTGPDWPAATLLDGPEDFLGGLRAEQACEKAHHLAYALGQAHGEGQLLCPACGADWGEAEAGQACALCDGWALARPCPVCDGACGAVWQRAVQDSLDSGRGVWIGTCAAPPK